MGVVWQPNYRFCRCGSGVIYCLRQGCRLECAGWHGGSAEVIRMSAPGVSVPPTGIELGGHGPPEFSRRKVRIAMECIR